MPECQLVPVKRLLQGRVTDGPHETPSFTDEGIPFLSVDGIQDGKLKFEGCRFISRRDADIYRKKCDPTFGDILLGKAASVGKVAYVDVDFVFSIWSPLALLRPSLDKLNGKFLYYCFQSQSVQYQIFLSSNFNTQYNIGMRDIENLCIPNIPVEKQDKIATFLDRKTTAIDTLIAKKQRLIELLKEKRAALINQAVTKGLNPDVLMKDSDIPWIGKIPEHWQAKLFKRVVSRIDVGIAEAATHAYADEGVPIVRSANVRTNYMDLKDLTRIEQWFADKNRSKHLRSGDILTVRTGANAGMTAVVPEELHMAQCFTLLIATPKPNQVSQFYSYFINSKFAQSFFSVEGWGAAQVNLSVPILQTLPIVEPPFEEQQSIVQFIRQATQGLDRLINKTQSSINRLQEYRQSLITAAVTGNLEVPVDEVAC